MDGGSVIDFFLPLFIFLRFPSCCNKWVLSQYGKILSPLFKFSVETGWAKSRHTPHSAVTFFFSQCQKSGRSLCPSIPPSHSSLCVYFLPEINNESEAGRGRRLHPAPWRTLPGQEPVSRSGTSQSLFGRNTLLQFRNHGDGSLRAGPSSFS